MGEGLPCGVCTITPQGEGEGEDGLETANRELRWRSGLD
jgi:hypothetical protein